MTEAVEEKMEQDVTIEDAGPARKKVTIVIPGDRIKEKIDENFRSLRKEAALPGFRQGRVPMKILKKRFSKDVKLEVSNQVFGESYTQAIEDNNLRVIGEPDFGDEVTPETFQAPEEGDWTITFELEIVPDFEMPSLAEFEIDTPNWEVTDEDVQKEVDMYADTYGSFDTIEDVAKDGDYLVADVEVKAEDGEVLDTLPELTIFVPGESREYRGAIGQYVVTDLGKELEGKKAGDEFTISTTGNKTHKNEKVADKPITIDVKAIRVDRSNPLPMDELIQRLGFEEESELRDQMRQHLEGRNGQRTQQATYGQLSKQLIDNIEFELPEDLSNRQVDQVAGRRAMELMYQGKSKEEVKEQMEELKKESSEQAQRELKLFFILSKTAEDLKIEVTDGELNHNVMMIAMQQGRRPEEVRQEMEQSGRLQELYLQIRESKTLDELLTQCKLNEITGAEWDEQQKEDGEEDAE